MRAKEFVSEKTRVAPLTRVAPGTRTTGSAPSRWAVSAAAQQAQAGGRDTKNTAIQNAQDMERFREKIMQRMEREWPALEKETQGMSPKQLAAWREKYARRLGFKNLQALNNMVQGQEVGSLQLNPDYDKELMAKGAVDAQRITQYGAWAQDNPDAANFTPSTVDRLKKSDKIVRYDVTDPKQMNQAELQNYYSVDDGSTPDEQNVGGYVDAAGNFSKTSKGKGKAADPDDLRAVQAAISPSKGAKLQTPFTKKDTPYRVANPGTNLATNAKAGRDAVDAVAKSGRDAVDALAKSPRLPIAALRGRK